MSSGQPITNHHRVRALKFNTKLARLCVHGIYHIEMSDHNQYCNMFDNFENEVLLVENENVKESDELLIDAVRAYPHLYDHKDSNFKDNLMKENSWEEIALAINIPGK